VHGMQQQIPHGASQQAARRSPAPHRCSSGQREAGNRRESPTASSDQWASECIIPEPGAPPSPSRHNGPGPGTRTRLRRPDQPGAVLAANPRPGRDQPPASSRCLNQRHGGGSVQVKMTRPPPKAMHQPDQQPASSSPARWQRRSIGRMRRLPPHQKRLGLARAGGVIQQQASPPATGDGDVAAATQGPPQ